MPVPHRAAAPAQAAFESKARRQWVIRPMRGMSLTNLPGATWNITSQVRV
jgi:hypothetical protein